MRLSFTGTREGMTASQKRVVVQLLNEMKPDWVIHGDCKGADTDFHHLILAFRGGALTSNPPKIEICPSTSESMRSYCEYYDVINPAKDSLARDRDIVDKGDKLIATPRTVREESRSGTWYTVRYAKRVNKIVYIIYPNGDIA